MLKNLKNFDTFLNEERKTIGQHIKYCDIVFCQGDDAVEPLKILDEEGKDAAMDYLSQWDCNEYNDLRSEPPAGTSDKTYKKDDYIMCYNTRIGYIGLYKIIKVS